ncbi:MAG: GGDEF domain-containing protein [Proteobacteria bacterium]|nr:GGDEF domain-containing protein [Pseudomonadota bacterium]
MTDDLKPPRHPALDEERLDRLARELTGTEALKGRLVRSGGRRTQGLAILLADLSADHAARILGRADFTLPLSEEGLETLAALKAVIEENERLKDQAVTDAMTGLYNRRYFRERLGIELERVKRTEKPCSLVMADLDHFKPVNDQYGHQVGDDLLRAAAQLLKDNLRAVDVPVRYGGDEFAIILPETGSQQALELTERILTRLSGDPLMARYGVTASLGLATHQYHYQESAVSLIERADQALYQVKREGGNSVRMSEADRVREASTELTGTEREALYLSLAELKTD